LIALAYAVLPSGTNMVTFTVNTPTDLLDNMTVGCDGCVSDVSSGHVWEAKMTFGNIPLDLNDSAAGSTSIKFGFGYSVPRNGTQQCPEYETSSICVFTYSNFTLPLTIKVTIHKTSTGGTLTAKIYRFNGSFYEYYPVGNTISETIQVRPASGYE